LNLARSAAAHPLPTEIRSGSEAVVDHIDVVECLREAVSACGDDAQVDRFPDTKPYLALKVAVRV